MFHRLLVKELQDKLTSAWYKMVKVINDWERSGAGRGMAVEDLEGEGVYKFINRDDRKNFLKERPPQVIDIGIVSIQTIFFWKRMIK